MVAILTELRLNLNVLTVLICISLMCTRVSSECIKVLNVRSGIMKSLEEKPGRTIQDLGLDKVFLKRTLSLKKPCQKLTNGIS